jgi:hypothetical protein
VKKIIQSKKLVLSRETLQQLDDRQVQEAKGGVTVSCTAESVCHFNSCYC